MWRSSSGEIPNDAVSYIPPKETSPIHFCQTFDEVRVLIQIIARFGAKALRTEIFWM